MNLIYNLKKHLVFCFFAIPVLILFSCAKDESEGDSVFRYASTQTTSYSVSEEGDIMIFRFGSTASWTAKSDADWITFPTSGDGGTIYFKMQVKENLSDEDRVGIVTINSGNDYIVLDISQKKILDKNNIKIIAVGQIVKTTDGVKSNISALWENDDYLRAVVSGSNASMQDIKYLNGDYYIAGYVQSNSGITDYIWKNANTKTQISPSTSYCNVSRLYCKGNDLYAVGYLYDSSWISHAIVWKNYDAVLSFTYNNDKVLAYDMAMIGDDYYIGGAFYDNYGNTLPAIFKNNNLLYKLSDKAGQVNAVATNGTSIYSCGYFTDEINGVSSASGCVWKDGSVLYNLSKDGKATNPERILLDGNDIYAAGITTVGSQMNATIWKNGEVLHTYESEGGVSRIMTMFTYNGDIYAGGFYRNKAAGNVAVIWKNDKVLYTLSDLDSKDKGSSVNAMVIKNN